MRTIKGILVVTDKKREDYGISVKEFEYNNYTDFYKLLDIRCFDIPERKIGKTYYSIYCDDEALLKDNVLPRSFVTTHNGWIVEQIYGNIFICKHTENGDIKSLTQKDIKNILEHSYHTFIVGNIDENEEE